MFNDSVQIFLFFLQYFFLFLKFLPFFTKKFIHTLIYSYIFYLSHELREIFWDVLLKQAKLVPEPYTVFYDGGNMLYAKERLNLSSGTRVTQILH